MRQGTIILVQPVAQPLTLADAKDQLRIDAADILQDVYIGGLIAAAHRSVESTLGYPIMRQKRQTQAEGFPSNGGMWLGTGDNLIVDQVEYMGSNGVPVVLANTGYAVDAVSRPARILPAFNTPWPTLRAREVGAVKVDWTAGWANAAAVPADIVHAIKLMIGHWFENREAVVVGTISTALQFSVDALLSPWRTSGIH
jgi:uncharacterized phiE125 gp8 family phage protein